MKIIVLKAKHIIALSLTLAVLLTAFFAFKLPQIQSAFASSDGRSLPIYSVQTDEKKISIGINCAWDDSDIPTMLSCLAEQDVKATFFLLGQWAEKYPTSAAAIAKNGHEIGSHSYSHQDLPFLSQEKVMEEISCSKQAIYDACGQIPILFRPPSGSYNDLVVDCIHQSNCIPIQWNIDTLDWKGLSAQKIADRVVQKLSPGSIILLHSGAEHSAESLPFILQAVKEAGYSIVPVGELIYPNSKNVDSTGMQLMP